MYVLHYLISILFFYSLLDN